MFNEDLSQVIAEVKKVSSLEKLAIYMKAANWLRDEFLQMKSSFNGTFSTSSEINSSANGLKLFLSLLVDGNKTFYNDLDEATNSTQTYSGTVLSIAQTIQYNAVKRRSKNGNAVTRHVRNKETPCPLYVGIKLRLQTTKSMLDMMHARG